MKREGVPACEPVGESWWWCRLKEKVDYLWDRASACILTVNHKTPDGDGDFAIAGGDGITVTDEDNGIRIEATITEETVEGIVGQEAAARQQADNALQADIDAEEQARISADNTLRSDINTRATQTALDAEETARQQADQALQADIDAEEQARISADNALRSDINTRATQTALDAEETARQQADNALESAKLDRDQGAGNAGKVLIVGGNGIVAPGTSSASVAWGGISGDLADQTDLSDALDAKADDADVVHLTGSETISGSKVFNSNIRIKKSSPQLVNQSTEINIDDPPTSWTRLHALYGSDANNHILHSISGGVNGSTVNMDILIATMRAGALVSDGLRIYATPTITYATAPNIPGTSTGQEIVNAASLNQWPSIVRTVGNQTVAGVKTFTETPQAPTPADSAAGMEIVTAAWVRGHEHPRAYTAARLQQILASGGSLMGHLTVESASADYSGMISAVLDSGGVSYTGGILSDGSSVLVCLSIRIITGISTANLMTLNGNRQSGSIVSLYGWVYDTNGKVVDP